MKILLVTYTYPPSKSVNGWRPFYFAKVLVDSGYSVDVLTRHFPEKETNERINTILKTPLSLSVENGANVMRIPHFNSWFTYNTVGVLKNTGLWKLIYLAQLSLGRLTQESYNKWFEIYLPDILKKGGYNLVMVESGPTNLVRVVNKYCSKYKTKYWIDFRDVYYHDMLKLKKLAWNRSLKIALERWYMRKSIQNANFILGESEAKLETLKIPKSESLVINNGYDSELWLKHELPIDKDHFIITFAGKLYENDAFLQKILDCIKLFLLNKDEIVKICFLAPGNESVVNLILSNIPSYNLYLVRDRISYEESIKDISSSAVLMYHGWDGYKGIFSTKIYDYLRSGNRVLLIPSDHDVLDQLLHGMPGCVTTDDIEFGSRILDEWYSEWKRGLLIKARSVVHYKQYSRESANELFLSAIEKYANSI